MKYLESADKDLRWFFTKRKTQIKESFSVNNIKNDMYKIHIKSDPVIMKITSHTHTKGGVKPHLNYLKRDGNFKDKDGKEYDLFNQFGQTMGVEDIDSFHSDCNLKAKAFSRRKENIRCTTNLMITKPNKIGMDEFKDHIINWASDNFVENDYVYTFHDDSTQHAHLVISYYNDRGKPLNPRKEDLREWRESFAEYVNENKKVPVVNSLSAWQKGKDKKGYKRNIKNAQDKGNLIPRTKEQKEEDKLKQKIIISQKRNALLRLYYCAKNDIKDPNLANHLNEQIKVFDDNFKTSFKEQDKHKIVVKKDNSLER